MYQPIIPDVTIAELREKDGDEYQVIKSIIEHFAMNAYKQIDGMGLEECIETFEKMIDEGIIKPSICYETGDIYMREFNPETGNYDLNYEG
jgi:hypothetical protein